MKLENIHIRDFKRFADLSITGLLATTKLVLLTGPNGSGKTSLFEAFNFWINHAKQAINYEPEYYERGLPTHGNHDWSAVLQRIQLKFHGDSVQLPQAQNRKDFYIRSAYRHEADFTTNGLGNADDILNDSRRPQRLIQQEQRVSENYQRMVAEAVRALYSDDVATQQKKVAELANELIGEVRVAMTKVFGDLVLEGPGNPLTNGTFKFKKGTVSGFHYKNLSGGEKAAFDLLLDFIVKRKAFNDTVYCIDEPELHMHTRLQARLLEVMFDLIPDNCQLWLSTHSIGMARKAAELNTANPGQVAFIDFHDQNFDLPVKLQPIQPNRRFWQQMFHTALDDLAKLVVPEYVVFCEGRKIGQPGKKPSFDVAVYQKIFSPWHPEVEFLPLGGGNEVKIDGKAFSYLLTKLAPGMKTWKVFDKDDRNGIEIEELRQEDIHVLSRRDIESFLWDDEVLERLCGLHGKPDAIEEIKQKKQQQLQTLPGRGKPSDDVKAITDSLYTEIKQLLGLNGYGNSAEAFSIEHLAPLIQPGMAVYEELAAAVLAPLRKQN
ncbi:AAA family ATPase [Piscinibacter sp.]|uniref:AAA family ATPase n=1 Tax=Piscinibacter sp. TaxID=1903157 RepID=UPI0039E242C4